eukprot:scaffold62908_cov27-Phaeocystis_antarctica.AAC.1
MGHILTHLTRVHHTRTDPQRLLMRDLETRVVDLDSRSVLPSGPWGLVAGFRRRGLVRCKD